MRERTVKSWAIQSGIIILLLFLVIVSLAGGITDELYAHFHLPLTLIERRTLYGHYLWVFMTRPEPLQKLSLIVPAMFLAVALYSGYRLFSSTRGQYMDRHKYAAYGSSHWQSKQETRSYYHQDNRGFILGDPKKKVYKPLPPEAFRNPKIASYSIHPFTSDLNHQYLVFGPPQTKKSTSIVLPNIYHAAAQGLSMTITDPKGELYQLSANYLREEGYKIVVLDYLHFRYGARQNLLSYVETEEELAELANMYLHATRKEGDKEDFWESAAQQLFVALLGFVHQTKGTEGSIADVYDLLPYVKDPKYILALFYHYNITGAPMRIVRVILAASEAKNTLGGIVTTLSTRLQLFALGKVRAQTCTTDFDLSTICDQKTAVFIWVSDAQKTYAPLVAAFWVTFFNTLYEKARMSPGGKLPTPLVSFYDELANIGKIADFDVKLTTMRSRNIFAFLVWHSISQMNLKYGEEYAKTIIASCDTKIVLGVNEPTTAKFFSEQLGDTTIETQTRRGARSVAGELQNLSQQYAGRKLRTPDELQTLDREYVLITQSGRPPVLLNKLQYQYWKNPLCSPATLEQLPTYELEESSPIPLIQLDADEDDEALDEHEDAQEAAPPPEAIAAELPND